MEQRLDKLVSVAMGISRSDAKKLISRGAVTAGGRPVRQADCKIDPEIETLCACGLPLCYRDKLYLLMNKPLGVVSSTDDPDSPTVLELLAPALRRKGLFPAGRLDKYSEGMLIITDDGVFAHRLLAPRYQVPKTYYVELDAPIADPALAAQFAQGVELGGGERSSPARLEILSPVCARVTIFEGIYHQVRRMFDRHGGHVTRLVRVQIGALPLDPALLPGESRLMTAEEQSLLLEPAP